MSSHPVHPRPASGWQQIFCAKQPDIYGLAWGNRFPGDYPQRIRSAHLWEYIVVVSGRARLLVAGQVIHARRGDVWIMGDAIPHGWDGTPGQSLNLLSWGWRKPPAVPPVQTAPEGWLHARVDAAAIRRLRQIHVACRNALRMPQDLCPWELQQHRIELELVLARAMAERPRPAPQGQTVETALAWMRAHLEQANPMDALCQELTLSPSTLNRLFLRQLHKPFAAVFRTMKMEQALAWLRGQRRSVKDVALSLGYKHPTDFSRAFRKTMGCAPSACRFPRT